MYGSSIKVIFTAVMHYSACLNRQMTSTSYKRIGFAGGEEGIPRHIVVILLRELIHGWRGGGLGLDQPDHLKISGCVSVPCPNKESFSIFAWLFHIQ